jgi:hypothetical protein
MKTLKLLILLFLTGSLVLTSCSDETYEQYDDPALYIWNDIRKIDYEFIRIK